MLKNRSAGETIPAGDDRPRKKLSFRDPEVVSPPRSGYSHNQTSSSRNNAFQQHVSRPHSIAGVVGLGGFSAQGGVPGLPSSQASSRSSSLTRSVTTSSQSSSSVLPPKGSPHNTQPPSHNSSRSSTRNSPQEGLHSQMKLPPSPQPTQTRQPPPVRKPEVNNESQPKIQQTSQQKPPLFKGFRRSLSHLEDESLVYNGGRNADPASSLSLEDLELENQAMRVVRTIGQAFEVCHKTAVKDKSPSPDIHADDISREGSEDSSEKPKNDGQDSESGQEDLITLPSDLYSDEPSEIVPLRPIKLEPLPPPSDALKKGETFASPMSELLSSGDYLPQAGTPLSVHHELQLLREQLEQQQQQTQAAVAQVHLLRDQLAAETAARLEAQARTHQLLVHNKDLLEHIQQLVLQVRDLEIKLHGGGGISGSLQMPPIPPDVKSDLSSSTPGASLWLTQHQRQLSRQLSTSLPDTPPTPSPTMGTQTFRFPSSFHSTSPLAAYSHSSSPLSPLISPFFMTSGDIILPVPHQESQLQRQQQYLQEQQQRLQQQLRQRDFPAHFQQKFGLQQSHVRADDGSCSTLSSGEGDHKRDSCGGGHSSSESIIGAMSHLYNTDHKRLAQVPEDGVPMTQFGNTPSTGAESLLSSQRSPSSGPITRAASERYSRQETLAQMQRMAWARHTTK